MKENKQEAAIQMSKIERAFLDLIKEDPIQIINGLSIYDLKKPLVWKDRKNGKTLQQIATKHRLTIQSVRTILKNIKNNS